MEVEGLVVNAEIDARPARVLSLLEQEVLQALDDLPPGYQIAARPEQIRFENDGFPYCYQPDLVIDASDGRRLIVEVKSHHSLSLSNMAKLAAIKRHARTIGLDFMVLVPDAKSSPQDKLAKEFDDLRIAFVHGQSNIVPTVLKAFNDKKNGR